MIAAAYTNSVAGATSTTLYVLGGTQNVLATQNPPNEGVLNTVGPLGLEVSTLSSFDIAPGSNTAYVATITTGRDVPIASLYTIDLNTGTATLVGVIGEGQPIRGLAVAPAAGAPAPAAPAAKPAGQPTPAPKPAPAAKPAPAVPAPVQAPRALPRTGEAQDWAIGGLALAGVALLGAGLAALRGRA